MSRVHEKGNVKNKRNSKEIKEKFFWEEIELVVNQGVYYPREDSELILKYLDSLNLKSKKVLDIGTGSGILAIFCVKRKSRVDAIDINENALGNAIENARRNSVKVNCFKSDMFENIKEKYDLILFNPPYLSIEKEYNDEEELSWTSGKENEALKRFLKDYKKYLKNAGMALIVISSLTSHKVDGRVVSRKKVPWEELLLLELT